MQQKGFLWMGALALVALAVACSGGDKAPASPTSPTLSSVTAGSDAAADGVTLKVNGPTPSSPIGGVRLTSMAATLSFQAATGKYVSGESYTYRVQLMNASSVLLEEQSGKALSYAMKTALDADTLYRWRARAELQGYTGAWSAVETFKSMEKPTGYFKGNEVYDPLTDGKTVGIIHGPVTWIPNVGLRLDGDDSSIEYTLTSTVVTGEFSMIVGNVGGGSGNDKSKIMTMREENGLDPSHREWVVDNDRRMTVEKREDGNVAWRFITHDDQVDTIGGERINPGIRDDFEYLWKATWDGRFTLTIQQLPGFNTIYNFGKNYAGPYDPNPHKAYAGSGSTFMGHGTVAGMVVRQVWLSPNPRPSWANQ